MPTMDEIPNLGYYKSDDGNPGSELISFLWEEGLYGSSGPIWDDATRDESNLLFRWPTDSRAEGEQRLRQCSNSAYCTCIGDDITVQKTSILNEGIDSFDISDRSTGVTLNVSEETLHLGTSNAPTYGAEGARCTMESPREPAVRPASLVRVKLEQDPWWVESHQSTLGSPPSLGSLPHGQGMRTAPVIVKGAATNVEVGSTIGNAQVSSPGSAGDATCAASDPKPRLSSKDNDASRGMQGASSGHPPPAVTRSQTQPSERRRWNI